MAPANAKSGVRSSIRMRLTLAEAVAMKVNQRPEGLSEVNPMRITLRLVCAGMVFVAATAPVRAHHSFASEFDSNKPVKFTATIVKMEWINPHSWMHI